MIEDEELQDESGEDETDCPRCRGGLITRLLASKTSEEYDISWARWCHVCDTCDYYSAPWETLD